MYKPCIVQLRIESISHSSLLRAEVGACAAATACSWHLADDCVATLKAVKAHQGTRAKLAVDPNSARHSRAHPGFQRNSKKPSKLLQEFTLLECKSSPTPESCWSLD